MFIIHHFLHWLKSTELYGVPLVQLQEIFSIWWPIYRVGQLKWGQL